MSKLPPTYVEGFHDVAIISKMKYNDFGETGMQISALSLGAAGFSSIYGECTLEECKETVLKAIKAGINYIDTAYWYGQGLSEEILGKCLKHIPREAYYIATKVCRYEQDPKKMFDFSAKKTKSSIDGALKRLGLKYVDVLQIHDIEFAPSIDYLLKETLPALQEAKQNGLTKFFGVTGYPVSALADLIKRSPIKIDTVLSYARFTLLDSTLKEYINDFKGLGIINAAAVAMGLLTNKGPQPWHPAHQNTKDVCEEARNYCKSKGVELGKLATHFALSQTGPHTTLVGITNHNILDQTLCVFYHGLNNPEKRILEHLKTNIFSKLQHHHWEGVERYSNI